MMRTPLLLALALWLAPLSAQATPFDFSQPYGLVLGVDEPPVHLHLVSDWGISLIFAGRLLPAGTGAYPLLDFVEYTPPGPELACTGCELSWGAVAKLRGSVRGEGPFSGWPLARFTLVGEGDAGWALKGWTDPEPPLMANPEPLSLVLMGGGLAAAGYWALRRRPR